MPLREYIRPLPTKDFWVQGLQGLEFRVLGFVGNLTAHRLRENE